MLPKACGTNGPIFVDYGYTLTSPNFPNAYDSNALCSWEFVSPPDTLLEIHFKHFEVSFAKELGFLWFFLNWEKTYNSLLFRLKIAPIAPVTV